MCGHQQMDAAAAGHGDQPQAGGAGELLVTVNDQQRPSRRLSQRRPEMGEGLANASWTRNTPRGNSVASAGVNSPRSVVFPVPWGPTIADRHWAAT